MDLESNSGDAENSQTSSEGVSRRSVMKAGAAVAWTVPLVQVVAAAPAVAVSGKSTLALSAASGSWSGNSSNLEAQVTITNTGSVATTSLQVTFTFDSAWTSGSASGSGWTVSPAGKATTKVYTFTAGTQLAPGAGTTLQAKFTSTTGSGFVTGISVAATAGNATNSPATQIPVKQWK